MVLAALGVRGALHFAHQRPDTEESTTSTSRELSLIEVHAQTVQIITRAISDPHKLYQRISERVTPLTRAYQVTTTHSVQNPYLESGSPASKSEASKGTAYDYSPARLICIPLPVVKKGRLHDEFKLYVNGSETSALAFDRGIGVILFALRSIAQESINKEKCARSRKRKNDKYEALERDIIGPLVMAQPIKHHESERVTFLTRLRAWLSRSPSHQHSTTPTEPNPLLQRDKMLQELPGRLSECVSDPLARPHIVETVRQLVDNYLLIVPLNSDQLQSPILRLTTTERKILRLEDYSLNSRPEEAGNRLLSWFITRLRRVYGLRPVRIQYSLDKALNAASYHLEMMGNDGTYLDRQRIIAANTSIEYRRFRSRQGQRYLHLYTRGVRPQATASDNNPRHTRATSMLVVKADFSERTPGTVGPAAISAAAALVIIFAAAQLSKEQGSARSDVVALLLAAPGAVVAWSGLESSGTKVGAAVLSRISATMTLLLCAGSALQFLLGVPGKAIFAFPADSTWNALVIAALLNFCVIWYSWARRATVYSYFLGKNSEEEAAEDPDELGLRKL